MLKIHFLIHNWFPRISQTSSNWLNHDNHVKSFLQKKLIIFASVVFQVFFNLNIRMNRLIKYSFANLFLFPKTYFEMGAVEIFEKLWKSDFLGDVLENFEKTSDDGKMKEAAKKMENGGWNFFSILYLNVQVWWPIFKFLLAKCWELWSNSCGQERLSWFGTNGSLKSGQILTESYLGCALITLPFLIFGYFYW